MINPFVSPRG